MLRRDYEKLRLAHELGRSIGLEVNLELLLEQIIMKAFELIPADRGVILLMEDGVPAPKIAKTRDGKNEQIVLSKSILNEVVTEQGVGAVVGRDDGQPLLGRALGHHAGHPVDDDRAAASTTTSCSGIMHLDSMIATNAFTEKDLQIFGGIASQAAVAIHNSQLARKIEHEAKTRAQFQRLLSPNLVDQVVQGKLQLEKGGALSEVTLLFSDIRGFTSMSESRAPEEIVRMLNEYFELMVDVIFKYEGTLDKFVGDEVIALFGAPVPMQERRGQGGAVRAGHDARAVGVEPHARRRGPARDQRSASASTPASSSRAPSAARARSSTRPSATRSTSPRACAAPRRPGQVILSEATFRKVQADVAAVPLPPIRVKGKADELRVYNAVGLRNRTFPAENTRPG